MVDLVYLLFMFYYILGCHGLYARSCYVIGGPWQMSLIFC